jgi:hypothetical protein
MSTADLTRAWVTADRDSERAAWEALYSALYPRPEVKEQQR